MSILVFAENWNGKFKKSTFEALSYANEIAKLSKTTTTAIAVGNNIAESDLKQLGDFGVSKILYVDDARFATFANQGYATVIAQAAKDENATVIVLSNSFSGKALAPRLAVKLQAGLATEVIQLPFVGEKFVVRKKVYAGKAFADIVMTSAIKILLLASNSYKIIKTDNAATVVAYSPVIPESDFRSVVKEVVKTSGKVSVTEAEIVVSGGRGMKGPENWGMLEELANLLGAATACTKPVADVGWRPHHEHVGQTGKAISPNLYIAIGISGAIQHLAGVNSSKVIVVINKDPEAPFLKAADYAIVGDAFEVVPKLIEAVKTFQTSHN